MAVTFTLAVDEVIRNNMEKETAKKTRCAQDILHFFAASLSFILDLI